MINFQNLKTFDAAEYIETKEDVILFLNEALTSGDLRHIIGGIETVLRSKPVREMQESQTALKTLRKHSEKPESQGFKR